MALTDWLIGDSSLKRQRDRAIDSAQERYDPSMFTPILDESRARATEGIGEAGNIARARTVQSLFSPSSFSTQTGNQGRALALQSQQTQARSQALADVESQLSQADIQARQQGQRQFAQARQQQLQTEGLREAAEDEAQMMYEAERDRRVQSLVGAGLGLAGNLLTTPFGAESTSLVERGLSNVFGDGASEVAEQAGNAVTEQANFLGMLEGIGNIPSGGESSGMGVDQQANLFNLMEGIQNISQPQEQTSPAGIEEQADFMGMMQGIENIPSGEVTGPSRDIGQPMSRLERQTQEMQALQGRDDLTFEEFSRLRELQGRRPAEVSLDVQRRMREDFIGPKGFGGVLENMSQQFGALGDFLAPPVEEQYADYQQETGQSQPTLDFSGIQQAQNIQEITDETPQAPQRPNTSMQQPVDAIFGQNIDTGNYPVAPQRPSLSAQQPTDSLFQNVNIPQAGAVDTTRLEQSQQGGYNFVDEAQQRSFQEGADIQRLLGREFQFGNDVPDRENTGIDMNELMEFTGGFEGFRNETYMDTAGKKPTPTIGFGTTRYPDGRPVQMGDTITEEQAREFKRADLQEAYETAPQIVPNFERLPREAQMVVTDMIYNMGAGDPEEKSGFVGFENMIEALSRGDFASAAREIEGTPYAKQTKRRARNHIQTLLNLAN